MKNWPSRIVYWVLFPSIATAAGILGYYAYHTAAKSAALGEQSIVQSTLLLVDEKVDRVESQIIQTDNAVFHLMDLEQPNSLEARWLPLAERISPSVTSLLMLDDSGNALAYASRRSERERRDDLKVFRERILPDLELERRQIGQLRHLHRTYAGRSTLISYRSIRYRGRRRYLIAFHDTDYVVREVFPSLFVSEAGKRLYNVVDEDNRRVYGPSLVRAGDYLVGRRFPSTLYGWRLQVAPKQAPLLAAQRRSGLVLEVALIGLSLITLIVGLAFWIYLASKITRLNDLRGEFVANVSHELKTPLSVVRMFAEMLLTGRVESPKKERQYLEIICRESERLSGLIENVLDFSAIERGKQTYDLRSGDLGEVVRRAVDTFRFRLEQEGLDIHLSLPDERPPAHFDEQAILLAVLNLIDNAAKYGGRNGPVEVSLVAGRRHAYVHVRDHGPGIPEDQHRRVFERFYRGQRHGATRGSGIGLSLVKRIVEAHDGKAWVENAKQGGAVVSFSIPLQPPPWGSLGVAG